MAVLQRLLIWGCLVAGPALCVLGLVGYVDILHARMPVTDRVCWFWKVSEGTLVWLQYQGDEGISVQPVDRATQPTFKVISRDDESQLMTFFLVTESRYRRTARQAGPFSWRSFSRPGLQSTRASVPIWLPGGLLLVGPVVVLVRQKLREERIAAGACAQCGYLLQGLTESRCPECGTAFAPAANSDQQTT